MLLLSGNSSDAPGVPPLPAVIAIFPPAVLVPLPDPDVIEISCPFEVEPVALARASPPAADTTILSVAARVRTLNGIALEPAIVSTCSKTGVPDEALATDSVKRQLMRDAVVCATW